MSAPFQLGTIGLWLAVSDPQASADWYVASLGMSEAFEFDSGCEAPGSPHLAVWLHDPDEYRLELSVQNGAEQT